MDFEEWSAIKRFNSDGHTFQVRVEHQLMQMNQLTKTAFPNIKSFRPNLDVHSSRTWGMSFAKEETHQHIPHFWSISLRDMERTPGLARSDSRMAIWCGFGCLGGPGNNQNNMDWPDWRKDYLGGTHLSHPLPMIMEDGGMEEAYMIYDMCWVHPPIRMQSSPTDILDILRFGNPNLNPSFATANGCWVR